MAGINRETIVMELTTKTCWNARIQSRGRRGRAASWTKDLWWIRTRTFWRPCEPGTNPKLIQVAFLKRCIQQLVGCATARFPAFNCFFFSFFFSLLNGGKGESCDRIRSN